LNVKEIIRFICLITIPFYLSCFWGCAGTPHAEKGRKIICDQLADQVMMQYNYLESIRLHEAFLEQYPLHPLALYHLGYSYGQLQDYEKEVEFYEDAITLGFYTGNIFFNLGMAYGELERMEEAIGAFKRGLVQKSNNPDLHLGLGMALQKMGLFEQAEDEYKTVIGLDPDNKDAIEYLERVKELK